MKYQQKFIIVGKISGEPLFLVPFFSNNTTYTLYKSKQLILKWL